MERFGSQCGVSFSKDRVVKAYWRHLKKAVMLTQSFFFSRFHKQMNLCRKRNVLLEDKGMPLRDVSLNQVKICLLGTRQFPIVGYSCPFKVFASV